MKKGQTVWELALGIGALALLALVVMPMLGHATDCSLIVADMSRQRNTATSMQTYATANKGYFPGLTSSGQYMKTGLNGTKYRADANATNAAQVASGDGCTLSAGGNLAMALLLEESSITPEQLISAGETNPAITAAVPKHGTPFKVGDGHLSHAMLAYGRASLRGEWTDHANPKSIILGTRLGFEKTAGTYHSMWTAPGSNLWIGSVVFGDGSTLARRMDSHASRFYDKHSGNTTMQYSGSPCFANLQYGGVAVPTAKTVSPDVIGVFGNSARMKNFDATKTTGMIGSVHDH